MNSNYPIWEMADYELEALLSVLRVLKLDHLPLSKEDKCKLYCQYVSMDSSGRNDEAVLSTHLNLLIDQVAAVDRSEVQKTIARSSELQELVNALKLLFENLLCQVPRKADAP